MFRGTGSDCLDSYVPFGILKQMLDYYVAGAEFRELSCIFADFGWNWKVQYFPERKLWCHTVFIVHKPAKKTR
jgi:hypothetical protein